jgi:hypothetical protein
MNSNPAEPDLKPVTNVVTKKSRPSGNRPAKKKAVETRKRNTNDRRDTAKKVDLPEREDQGSYRGRPMIFDGENRYGRYRYGFYRERPMMFDGENRYRRYRDNSFDPDERERSYRRWRYRRYLQ